MKKYFLLALGLCMTMAFTTSCKSSESAYKKAYEKAKQQELAQTPTEETIEVAPVQTAPVQAAPAAVTSAVVREEKVTVVTGNALQDFSVVCGSFGSQVNANNLKSELDAAGYNAVVAYNASNNMYRVIVSTHPTREAAAQAREQFKARYANDASHADFQKAWLLYNLK